MKLKYSIFAIFLILLISCSNNEKLAGGSGTETTNGILILSKTGKPISGAEVKVYDGDFWLNSLLQNQSPLVTSLKSDAKGYVIPPLTDGIRSLHVVFEDQVAIDLNNSDTIRLGDKKSLKIKAEGIQKIIVTGTEEVMLADKNYLFEFKSLALNSKLILIKNNQVQLGPNLNFNETQIDSIEIDSSYTNEFVLENFEGLREVSDLELLGNSLKWWGFTDTLYSTFAALNINENQSKLGIIKFDGYLGENPINQAWVGLGTWLMNPNGKSGFDFSNVDSIKIRIKGTGIVGLSLETFEVDTVFNTYHPDVSLELSEEWQEFVVAMDVFKEITTGLDRVLRLELTYDESHNEMGKSYWFEMDEIKLIGKVLPLW